MPYSKLAQAVTILAYIQEMPGWNLGWNTNYSDWNFLSPSRRMPG
jgi:hypothetical protein